MAERQFKIGKVQVVLTHSSTLLKVIVAVLIVLSIAALVALNFVSDSIHGRTEDMRREQAALEHENEKLEQKIEGLGSVDSYEQIAKEELGLVSPDTIIIQPQN